MTEESSTPPEDETPVAPGDEVASPDPVDEETDASSVAQNDPDDASSSEAEPEPEPEPEPVTEPEAEPATAAADAEPVAALTPKQRRAAARAAKAAPARAAMTVEERVAERAEVRARKAAERRRARVRARAKRGGGAVEPTPPVSVGRGRPKLRQGVVVSDKPNKTIVVRIDVTRRHQRYEKIVRSSTTLHAHDERNEAGAGDKVSIVESRPLSRTKRWRLVEVLEKAR